MLRMYAPETATCTSRPCRRPSIMIGHLGEQELVVRVGRPGAGLLERPAGARVAGHAGAAEERLGPGPVLAPKEEPLLGACRHEAGGAGAVEERRGLVGVGRADEAELEHLAA